MRTCGLVLQSSANYHLDDCWTKTPHQIVEDALQDVAMPTQALADYAINTPSANSLVVSSVPTSPRVAVAPGPPKVVHTQFSMPAATWFCFSLFLSFL